MKCFGNWRRLLAVTMGAALLSPGVMALLRLNDGRDQLFLLLSSTLGWDSNLFANADQRSDTLVTASALVDYRRRAGMIGVDGSVGVELGRFARYSSENYVNPRASVALLKNSGRTTGSVSFSAIRESSSDVAANLRAESWLYESLLKLRYPVIDRYSISASYQYTFRDFTDEPILVDLETHAASVDLLYALDSRRDLFAGYRLRRTESAQNIESYDQAFTIGITGRIIPRLNGTVRLGYQFRDTRAYFLPEENFSGLNAGIALTWTATRRLSFTGQISKDFATTSTDLSSDSFASSLDAKWSVNSKLSFTAGVGYGTIDYLGIRGANRQDTYSTLTATGRYLITDKVHLSLSASRLTNWSTLPMADYTRNAITLGVSARF